MAEDNVCTIRFVRPPLFADRIRSYKILLNGKVAGSIGHDSTLEIAAPAGATTLEARIDWARSRPPLPGESEVISQFERLSSNDTKIAPNCVRIAVGPSEG